MTTWADKRTKSVLLFGDQTDSWVEDVDQAYAVANSAPWLKTFLCDLTMAVKEETRAARLDPVLQESLGTFSSLQELGERYRHTTDELGMAHCLLLHTARASSLLRWVRRDASILCNGSDTQLLGISGGLFTMSALAASDDFEALCAALLEIARLLVRLCKFTSVKSRSIEDQSGIWGWAVLGLSLDELSETLEQFQQSVGIPPLKRAKPGVTGAGWSTVIGPPSVLQQIMRDCRALKQASKNPLKIRALQHTIDLTKEDIDFIVGDNGQLLNKSIRATCSQLWGMDEPGATYASWGDMLRAVCSQVLSRGLDIPKAVARMNASALGALDSVRVIEMGATSHTPYLVAALEKTGREVLVETANTLSRARPEQQLSAPAGRVAIVGVSGRGPMCDNIDEFWQVIMTKTDTCTEVPPDRFDLDEFYCADGYHNHGDEGGCTMTTKYGCFMRNPGRFDSRFFRISPREAMLMDPSHRQFLMSTYEALEMAGYSDGRTKATDPTRIGTFYGQVTDDWHDQSHPTLGCDAYTLPGVQRAFGPGRVAWQFNWEGPTYALDSACASTTSAIHLACMSLRAGDIDMAVAGASNILNYPHSFAALSKSGVLSNTGNCKPFRDDADGYCRGDFVGCVVLKRLEDAEADNDEILAVIAASGRNHSGNAPSITTPDERTQRRLFRTVLRNAGVSADDISYVEMHGTGTPVGDPVELSAVGSLLKHTARNRGPIPVGSVKANLGHGEGAAGMASLMKCIKMFETNTVPPQQGFPHALNPKFPALSELNIEIPSEPKEFGRRRADVPRRILLNNFDAAGGNACMLLEEYMGKSTAEAKPSSCVARDPRSCHVVALSARTPAALLENKRRLVAWLRANPEAKVDSVAYTTTARRMHHSHRFACTASTTKDITSKLERDIASQYSSSAVVPSLAPPIVFVFTGQGSHYAGMGRELYRTSPAFRESVDLCARTGEQHNLPPFVDIIADGEVDMASKTIVQTNLAVVALEIGLAAFWKSVGVQPATVMGHSLGEYSAMHVAGVLSLADTIYLVGQRAALVLERCDPDAFAMLSVAMPAAEVRGFLASHPQYSTCGISCVNSTSATVISGSRDDILKLHADLAASARCTLLRVPYGFHSFQMDPILADYKIIAEGVTFLAPRIPVASTLLESIIDTEGTFNAHYLAGHTRKPVNFVGGLNATTLDPLANMVVSSLDSNAREDCTNWTSVSRCMAAAYLVGVPVDWLALHRPYEGHLALLKVPTYAWDTKDYWVTFSAAADGAREAPGARRGMDTAKRAQTISTLAQYVVRESSSSGTVSVTLGASLADPGLSAIIDGHQMQSLPILPGSAFCESGLAAAAYALKGAGRSSDASVAKLSLRNPQLKLPLTKKLVGTDGELLTTVTLDKTSRDIRVSWKASPAHRGPMYELGSCTLAVCPDPEGLQASWDSTSYFIKARMDEIVQSARQGRGHRFQPDIYYALFAQTVQYSSEFKTVKEAFVSDDFSEAAAEIVLRDHPTNSRFLASPYWGESVTNLAGFAVNANPKNLVMAADSCFINSGFVSFEQTVPFKAGETYWNYVRVRREDKGNKVCDVYVFESSGRLVAQCLGLNFHIIGREALQKALGGVANAPRLAAVSNPNVKRPAAAAKGKEEERATAIETSSSHGIELQEENQSFDNAGVFDAIMQTIVAETKLTLAELTDDTALTDIGIDSIMSIEIASKVTEASGYELSPSSLAKHVTIGGLRSEFDIPQPATTPSSSSQSEQSGKSIIWVDHTPSGGSSSSFSDVDETTEKTSSGTPTASTVEIGVGKELELAPKARVSPEKTHDSTPEPGVKITLLKGAARSRSSDKTEPLPPLYMIADGTGTIATYLHLPVNIKTGVAMYGIDSPYLHCPARLTPEVGIPGAAKLIVEALIKKQREGTPFWIGGFSGGALMAYEVCRQLSSAGHSVGGLLLIDMCAPRLSHVPDDGEIGLAMFEAISGQDDSGVWQGTDNTRLHLQALFASVAAYNPPLLDKSEEPPAWRTVLIWAEKGMIDRCTHSARFNKLQEQRRITTTAYPGFMQDPALGAVMWGLPHKTRGDLGPNGWDKFVGSQRLMCMSINADHLQIPTPSYAPLLGEHIDKALSFFQETEVLS
ncbi:beta-ketoacyl synthase domain-containing protein [Colletotrichum navitas]|uniref:Beta-ketoacyl synthase domain-containing protein n=1 Tax=Colletotrichum navitas TaxID=681940 RepID=A0AAD8PP42_9PEZI|nr:beta-ketoacyl synthase domain-containing protein [Colletotrichum navitas]KAK1573275.1 beta-ketoacyl synthase domain-containing protein [Colletotrichum navitas]